MRHFLGKLFLVMAAGFILAGQPAHAAAPDLVFASQRMQRMREAVQPAAIDDSGAKTESLQLASRTPSSFPKFHIRTTALPKLADMVLVRKGARTLSLMKDGGIIRSFRMALGKTPVGHKVFEGDGRTPEGFYTIDARRAASNFYKALHISYPRPDDVSRARALGASPGGAIMIHGLPNDISADYVGHPYEDWTDGCIAVTNAEMDEIWKMVSPGIPIVILP